MIIEEKAYAKINLILNVLNKRDDGYHEVDFLMHSLDLHDDVKVEIADEDEIIVENDPTLNTIFNLAYQAIPLMRSKYNLKNSYKITIRKRIPVAAGMAGGSSDAAATIRAINKLENLNRPLKELEEIAARLGSDVPYCLYSNLSHAINKGEVIIPIEKEIEKLHVVVVNPGVKLSTKKVFTSHEIDGTKKDINDMVRELNFNNINKNLFNHLEQTATKICPEINELKNEMSKYTTNNILLSGSGPTLFVLFKEEEEATKFYGQMKSKYDNTFITKFK